MEGRGWWCHHPRVMPLHPSWHLKMMFHVASTPTCHATSTVSMSSNTSGRWSMVRLDDLGECIQKSLGIIDRWWVYSPKSTKLVGISNSQWISSMVDGLVGRFRDWVQIGCWGDQSIIALVDWENYHAHPKESVDHRWSINSNQRLQFLLIWDQ